MWLYFIAPPLFTHHGISIEVNMISQMSVIDKEIEGQAKSVCNIERKRRSN